MFMHDVNILKETDVGDYTTQWNCWSV